MNAEKWAEFGLAGMVIGALFMLVYWFMSALKDKDECHARFIKEILSEDREERTVERHEHREITNRLSDALDGLAKELRKD